MGGGTGTGYIFHCGGQGDIYWPLAKEPNAKTYKLTPRSYGILRHLADGQDITKTFYHISVYPFFQGSDEIPIRILSGWELNIDFGSVKRTLRLLDKLEEADCVRKYVRNSKPIFPGDDNKETVYSIIQGGRQALLEFKKTEAPELAEQLAKAMGKGEEAAREFELAMY